jgi:hypothetical protein
VCALILTAVSVAIIPALTARRHNITGAQLAATRARSGNITMRLYPP